MTLLKHGRPQFESVSSNSNGVAAPSKLKESKVSQKKARQPERTVTPNEVRVRLVLGDAVESQKRAGAGGACPGRDTSKGQRIATESGR